MLAYLNFVEVFPLDDGEGDEAGADEHEAEDEHSDLVRDLPREPETEVDG